MPGAASATFTDPPALRIVENAPLDRLNTFGVSARARRLVVLDDERQLPQAIEAMRGFHARCILGGGSNVLFAGDFDGAVLLVRTRGRERVDEAGAPADGGSLIRVQAGEPWDSTVQWSLAQGLAGLENLAMIPGSTGAAAIQNIGAYGLELSERFDSLRAIDLDSGEVRRFTLADCRFGYRDSVFKQPGGSRWLVLELVLRVGADRLPVLTYGELKARFAGHATQPTAIEIDRAVREIRSRKLPDPAVIGNAGSFFKNPVVDRALADGLREREAGMPIHPAGSATGTDQVKLSAGWLIDRCGWKGVRLGDAGVHEAHALVLVNHGSASGHELLELARLIRDSVHERFGIWLEPEPVIVGRL